MTVRRRGLGAFETLVLAAVVRLGPTAYGATIKREIESCTQRTVRLGALYAALSRMENKGLVSSELGDSEPVRGGRAKRYYHLLPAGQAELESSLSDLAGILRGTTLWPST